MKILILLLLSLTSVQPILGQVGTIRAETYQADFEKSKSIEEVSDYSGEMIPVALLNISASEHVYEMWPELRDARIGLGVTNMVIEYLDWTNRFTFVEDEDEIKERMRTQWVASRKGVSANEVYGLGEIILAEYFVTIEIYDFSVSEDEILSFREGSTQTQTTRLGLQIRFTNATNGTFMVGSGLGEASTVKTQEGLLGLDVEEINFRQSGIGVSTRRSLETASARVVSRMISRGIFEN